MAMKKYLYETHLHTTGVSRCASATVREHLEHYKSLGYAGVFITNHFIDGNIRCGWDIPYAEAIEFYFTDYEEAVRLGREIGISVFSGMEIADSGTEFLVYGLDKKWFLEHPEYAELEIAEKLTLLADAGALIIHAHPFYENPRTKQIRLFPHLVHGVEAYNSHRTAFDNEMAMQYAENYGLIKFSGTDNHGAARESLLGGVMSDTPIKDERDFIEKAKAGELEMYISTVSERRAELE